MRWLVLNEILKSPKGDVAWEVEIEKREAQAAQRLQANFRERRALRRADYWWQLALAENLRDATRYDNRRNELLETPTLYFVAVYTLYRYEEWQFLAQPTLYEKNVFRRRVEDSIEGLSIVDSRVLYARGSSCAARPRGTSHK